MRTRRLIKEHIAEKWVASRIICDLCQKRSYTNERWDTGYDFSEITIEAHVGSSYPEGDCRDAYSLDVCPDCFLEKIKPLIETAFGVKFAEYSSEGWDTPWEKEQDDASHLGG